jgi:acetylornithine deacetylase/succinyl-diaminopimelate desuccinylase-like protein
LLTLAKSLIEIPSVSGGEEEIARHLAAWFRARGLKAELQFAAAGRPNVVARLPGAGHGKSLMLTGHIDMTEPLTRYRGPAYIPTVENGILFGAGVTNMKGAIAAMAETMVSLASAEALRGDVVFAAVVGECDQLGLGTKACLAAGLRADAAICAEGTGMSIFLSHAGVYQFRVRVQGAAAHQKERHLGRDAIADAIVIASLLRDTQLFEDYDSPWGKPSLVIGEISGGVLPSVLAPSCDLVADIRTVPGMTEDQVSTEIGRVLANALSGRPGLQARVDRLAYSPAFTVARSESIVQTVASAIANVTGEPATIRETLDLGVTDASHLAAAGIPTALCGPGDWSWATEREGISLSQLSTAAAVYLRTAQQFCR